MSEFLAAEVVETENPLRGGRWPMWFMGVMFFIGLVAVALWNIELPYLAFSAGPVSDAADAIVAGKVDTYPPEGELLMLTIVSQKVNVYEAILTAFDPTVDLVPTEHVRRPDETDEEYRNRVLQQMDDSNFRAVAVALQYLGYEMVPVEVVVNELVTGVPAETVLHLGDTLVSVDGVAITNAESIRPLLTGKIVGEIIEIGVNRDGEFLVVEVELAERDDEPGTPMIGVVLGEITESPFPLSIEAGDVGGPSAGMMHTLAIIDTLTEGELTRGRVIAGTGTIQMDGTVGAIGGIRQKVVGAEAAGADYILVPEANYESALTAERQDIEIIPVANLDDAIEFLESLDPV